MDHISEECGLGCEHCSENELSQLRVLAMPGDLDRVCGFIAKFAIAAAMKKMTSSLLTPVRRAR